VHASWGGAGIAVYAPLGTNGQGYTLAPGYRLTFSGFITNTTFNWGNQQFRFGLLSDNGEPAEVVTNWVGYWIPNTTGGSHSDGPHKRASGQTNGFWQTGGSVLVGSAVAATGSATGGNLPNGVYAFSIMLARLDGTNLNITWELNNVCDRSMKPVEGIYSFVGTATDANVNGWSFNRAMLFTGNGSGTVSCGELAVTFGRNTPTLANLTTKRGAGEKQCVAENRSKRAGGCIVGNFNRAWRHYGSPDMGNCDCETIGAKRNAGTRVKGVNSTDDRPRLQCNAN
jgi:hypothetical protein